MKSAYSIILSPIRTEKGTRLLVFNKYLFWVDKKANKPEIKAAIKEIYKVKVEDVNTVIVRGKKKRVRYIEGVTRDWKKAIVTLAPDEKIDIT